MAEHELSRDENDPQGYGDGTSAVYTCTCGVEIDAMDIDAAFEHGRATASEGADARVPLALIHVNGGIATSWYVVAGTGEPEVYILDFDREGETNEARADFLEIAHETLAVFKTRGVDTSLLAYEIEKLYFTDEGAK